MTKENGLGILIATFCVFAVSLSITWNYEVSQGSRCPVGYAYSFGSCIYNSELALRAAHPTIHLNRSEPVNSTAISCSVSASLPIMCTEKK